MMWICNLKSASRHCFLMVAGLLCLVSFQANAELLQVAYTNSSGKSVASDLSTKYLDPISSLDFYLAGGLDRRLKVKIIDATGVVVSEQLSDLISGDDRITVDGKTYYGFRLTLPRPAKDGQYVVQTALTDSAGAALQSKTLPVYFDVVAPFEPIQLSDADWDNPLAALEKFDGKISINGGEPLPISYSPTNFSEENYNYAQSSATGLLQLSGKSWIKLAMQNGKLYLIQVHDMQNDADGGRYNASFERLPAGTSVIVSDDPSELQLGRKPEGQWAWAPCCTDGGVLGIPYNEDQGLDFEVEYSGAENINQLIVFNNDGQPYEIDSPNSTVRFMLGGDNDELQVDAWRYFETGVDKPYYEFDVRGLNIKNAGSWDIVTAKLQLRNGAGALVAESDPATYSRSQNKFQFKFFPQQGLDKSGTYQLILNLEDNRDNDELFEVESRFFDVDRPLVEIFKAGVEFESGEIQTLDDFALRISDPSDERVRPFEIRLSGGAANDNIYLTVSSNGDDFRFEYPLMFPSINEGESYTLIAKAIDSQGNIGERTISFDYKPPQVNLANGLDGIIRIPASPHAFNREDGSAVVATEPLTLNDGSLVTGVYDVYATLRSDSEVPLLVNGVEVQPGATMSVLPAHDFGASMGRLEIPVAAAQQGVEGSAHLLITTTAPNAPIVLATLETWSPKIQLHADDWTVYPALQPISIQAAFSKGAPCALTGTHETAFNTGNAISEPVCFLEWIELPSETYANKGDDYLAVKGYTAQMGIKPISYQVSLFDTDGSKTVIETGEATLEVLMPEGVVQLAPSPLPGQVERFVEHLDFQMVQTSGPACALTLDEDYALDESALGRPTCLLSWVSIPDGLHPPAYGNDVALEGHLEYESDQEATLAWRLDAFTPVGTKVDMGFGQQEINLVDPPAPAVVLDDSMWISGNLYETPKNGGYLGDYTVEARSARVAVESYRDGVLLEEEELQPFGINDLRARRRLYTDTAPLWSITEYEVRARYRDLPRVENRSLFRALSVPDSALRPYVEPDRTESLNTELLGVTVGIENPFETEAEYDLAEMGKWEVRLINSLSLSQREPITEFQELDALGQAHFDVDLKDVESTGFRLMAEARLLSPVPEYTRTEYSPRPAYITVLRGEAIASAVESRRLVGEAPLMIMGVLGLEDRLDYSALGDVIWEERVKDGEWVQIEDPGRVSGRLVRTYTAGEYQLRARVFNKHSGAVFITEAVDIIAFDVPEVKLQGPLNAFIGDTVQYHLAVTLNNDVLDERDVTIEWSEDGGDTWTAGSLDYQLTRDSKDRVSLYARVRMKNAPQTMDDSWVLARNRVSFNPVEPPRGGIFGPRMVELGESAEWRGVGEPPFRDMDITVVGQFLLPDGSVEDGELAEYTVTDEDLRQGYITLQYRSWIEGFEDQGAETIVERKVRVWEYAWPDWTIYARQSATQAPADLHIRLRNPGGSVRYLEGLSFEWRLPAGAEIIEDRYEDGRSLHFSKPGIYPVEVLVRDERGNESLIRREFELFEQDPWVVSFTISPSNDYQREPLTLSFRPNVRGGHPRDRISEFRYFKNGELVSSESRYGEITLEKGSHTVGLEVLSEFGHAVRSEQQVEVKANQPPRCTMYTRTTDSGWRFYAHCEDVDGVISEHRWAVNGEVVGVRGSRISVTSRDGTTPTISLIGVDDAGAESEPVIW